MSEDERLFAVYVNDYWNVHGKRIWDERIRPRIQRPESAGFRNMLAEGIGQVLVPAGDPHRWGYQLQVDASRVNRVLENILRGLTFFHGGRQKLSSVEFQFGYFGPGRDGPGPTLLDVVQQQPYHDIAGVIDYRWGRAMDEPEAAIAAVRFYRRSWFVVASDPFERTKVRPNQRLDQTLADARAAQPPSRYADKYGAADS